MALIWQIIWHSRPVRTTLDLDDDLIAALRAKYPDMSKTEAIETAIADHLRRSAYQRLRSLAGTLDLDDVSVERKHDRHT